MLPLHALIFRGLLRRIARRAVPLAAPAHLSTFTYCSIIDAPAAEVFRWHEQPAALAALTPAALVRIEQQEGGIRDGGRVTLSIGIGPARVRWVVRHHGYVAGRRFCDEQVRGPFARLAACASVRADRAFADALPGPHRVRGLRSRRAEPIRGSRAPPGAHAGLRAPPSHRAGQRRPRASPGRTPMGGGGRALAAAATLPTRSPRARRRPAPVRTVPFVDLDRYAGDWFEIARFPNRFQRQCVGDVRASYARRADGRLDVVNRCRTDDGQIQARGIARIVDERTFARLKVRFAPAWLSCLPFVWGDYWIIGLAEDYSWAVVGSPDREYLWILARTPHLDDERAAAARGVARANGFDVERLIQSAHEGNHR